MDDSGAQDPILLEVHDLTRAFGEITVLSDVSFTLAPGEGCAVVGPNGSGKTTLLRCVVGADRADSGWVRLAGRPMDEADPVIRAAVASVLDDVDFFPDLSVAEHLELLAYAHGADPAAVPELLSQLAIHPARDQLPATLSSGQRRRLALASAFVRPCQLLVLDEPEQRLDDQGMAWLVDALRGAKVGGTTVLLASHSRDLVHSVADSEIEIAA